jgi:signal peptidase II
LKKALIIIFLILICDQILKIWVKTHMTLGQNICVFPNWFYIHFTENEGMAFGMKLGGNFGKLFLSIFRIVAVIIIGGWLYKMTHKKEKVSNGLIFCISLILAGAIGNILDSAFYGIIFGESSFMEVAKMFPSGGGYSYFLHGKVVDMLYFPLLETHYPHWFPFVGGEEFIFFRPVFNISDSAITTGVLLLIIFQKRFFNSLPKSITSDIQQKNE